MDRKAAKELLHIKGWLHRVDEIVERGRDPYLANDLLQEAGDSLMMKLGEEANRLSRLGVLAPDGVRVDFVANEFAGAFYEREGFTVERIESSPTGNPALGVVCWARPLGCIR